MEDSVCPALGLTWSSFITTRLFIRRTEMKVSRMTKEGTSYDTNVRSMEIIFCPWLPRKCTQFMITDSGIGDY